MHDWKIGNKEIKGFFVDTCTKCGALKLQGLFTEYVKPEESKVFLTTHNPVEFVPYFECEGDNNAV